MIEFSGTAFQQPVEDEVVALAQAAQDSGKWMFTDLNGIRLVADPHPSDPDYTHQLLWTFQTVFQRAKRNVIGERTVYQNLIPELRVIGALALGKPNVPDLSSPNKPPTDREMAQWMLRLVPATWSKWSWTEEQNNSVLHQLDLHETANATLRSHLGEARDRLSRPIEPLLDEAWHRDVTVWLNNTEAQSH